MKKTTDPITQRAIVEAQQRTRRRAYFVASRNLATLVDGMPNAPADIVQEWKRIAYELAKQAGPERVSEEEFASWVIRWTDAPDAPPEPGDVTIVGPLQ